MNIRKAIFALRSLGLRNVILILQYSLQRDRLDKRYLGEIQPEPPGEPLPPGMLKKVETFHNGGRLFFERASLEICFLASDLVRISWTPGIAPLPYALSEKEWDGAETTHIETEDAWIFSTDSLILIIARDGGLTFKKPGGRLLRSDLPPTRPQQPSNAPALWRHTTHLAPDEHIYGLGERAAPLNRRGRSYKMWNTVPGGSYGPGKDPLYICIPAYMSMHSGGSSLVFYENPYKAQFDIGISHDAKTKNTDSDTIFAQFEDGMLRYYFIPGPPDRLIERYTELTGRAPIPPKWAFGYHLCRWGYKKETDIVKVLDGFAEHEMPLSAIHLDIDYMDGYRVFTVDSKRFPDISRLAKMAEERSIKLVAIIDPGVKEDHSYKVYNEGLEANAFASLRSGETLVGRVWPGRSVYPDFTDPHVREWWGGYYSILLDNGIAGVWHDMNEPTSFTAWGDMTLPLETRHSLEGRGGDHRQAHNLYGLLMNRAGREALERLMPGRRPWIISRSGWAGMQKYSWNWTGDTETSWDSLRITIPTILGLALCGVPFNGPDIGGFFGNPSPELYLRWFQMASFLIYFRTHSAIGTVKREPWVYGEPYTSILRSFLELRYSLEPYFYTLAWNASQTGHPPIRPLFWIDHEDKDLWGIEDAFLVGDNLLVAPIMEAGASFRRVRLPRGTWYSFWDNRLWEGPSVIQVEACLEQIPVFVRAGSVLPMEQEGRLVLNVYPPVDISPANQLYSDEGDGYGPWRVDRFKLSNIPEGLEITRKGEGDYPFPYKEIIIYIYGEKIETMGTGIFERLLLQSKR
jgi:alpha-glucosidase